MQELYTVFHVGLASILISPLVSLVCDREAFEASQVEYIQELQELQNQRILDSIRNRN